MDLFNRILMDSKRIPHSTAFSELKQFIRYSTRQFFKGAAQYPLLFVEALIPTIKSNRTMWEMPDEDEIREKENYLADVNYIPPAATTSTNQSTTAPKNNEESIDEEMMDYYFSEFDRKKQLEDAQSTAHQDTTDAVVEEEYDFFGDLNNADVEAPAKDATHIAELLNNDTIESTNNEPAEPTKDMDDSTLNDQFTAEDLDLESMVDR